MEVGSAVEGRRRSSPSPSHEAAFHEPPESSVSVLSSEQPLCLTLFCVGGTSTSTHKRNSVVHVLGKRTSAWYPVINMKALYTTKGTWCSWFITLA